MNYAVVEFFKTKRYRTSFVKKTNPDINKYKQFVGNS